MLILELSASTVDSDNAAPASIVTHGPQQSSVTESESETQQNASALPLTTVRVQANATDSCA
jgi:hypothetical protein